MPSDALKKLLEDKTPRGVFWLTSHAPVPELTKQAKAKKMMFYHLEGKKIEKKEQFLNHASVVMHFPSDSGKNWDAFYDCITDMEWAEADGYLIYFDHTEAFDAHHESQLETVIELFEDAVNYWKDEGKYMLVLLSGENVPHGVKKL